MIALERRPDRLLVSQRPGVAYRLGIGAWTLLALALGVSFEQLWSVAGQGPTIGLAFLTLAVGLGLLVRYRSSDSHFDRHTGTLTQTDSGLLRSARTQRVPLVSVAAVLERPAGNRHSIEVVLADRSTLVVARGPAGSSLERVARELSSFLEKPLELSPGLRIAERFEIERLVAQGGMGVVYRALDRTTSQPIALKLLLGTQDDPEHAERFGREMRTLESLAHPRIARHIAHGTTANGALYLAMEWVDGPDLRSVLERARLSLEDTLAVMLGAARAIARVHEQGIVHRDLKPGNLMLRAGGPSDVVLVDFGLARRLDRNTRVTASTTAVGTPHYMAPEQASGSRDVGTAADVFALGCIFYECLTGQHPFMANQLVGILARILFDQPEPVSVLCPSVPAPWAELLTRMLAKDPAQRPPHGAALVEELERVQSATLPPPEAFSDTISVSDRDSTDQVLVCVVLAKLRAADSDEARFESLRLHLARFAGRSERLADDMLVATILPRSGAIDQARIAASCALFIRERMPEAHIAVATGRAALRRDLRVGDAVDRAAQLLARESGSPGIRLDAVSAGLLAGRYTLDDVSDPAILIGEALELDQQRTLLGKPTPCVGREVELMQLESLMAGAVEDAAARAAVVLGQPGIGKSRVRHELLRRLSERYPALEVLVGYGDPLTAGSAYVIVRDALRRRAGIRLGDEPARARSAVESLCERVAPAQQKRVSEFLGELCGVPFPADDNPPLQAARGDHRVMSEQIASAFYDWIAAECQAHPLLLVLEDLQWGDAISLQLVQGALRAHAQGALFVLVLARPEVEETFPKLLADQRALSLTLQPLGARACELFVREVLGDQVDPERLSRMTRLAAGNALFLEELVRAAADGKSSDVPGTVLAVLQARLSRLSPEARQLLRAASVLGETFWQGAAQAVCECWQMPVDVAAGLGQLAELELVVRQRTSRFPGEQEYTFRHALVRDAALGLATAHDRSTGHAVAATWLEQRGETDAVVLARHAEEAGDVARTLAWYARAAEQSLERYDFGEALARATKALELAPQGETLGALLAIQSSAHYSLGSWAQAADRADAALELLPRGTALWCAAAERLMHVLPVLARFERVEALSEELLQVEPVPEAHTAYLRAMYVQLLAHALAGARERGQTCLDFIDRLRAGRADDLVARGYASMWRALYEFMLGSDFALALSLSRSAVRDLEQSQVMHRLSLAYTQQAFLHWGLGDLAEGERAARRGRAIADQIRDAYHASRADWYLALNLSEQADPEKLAEAERLAGTLIKLQVNDRFATSVCNTLTARVALARSEWLRAEEDGRAARAGLYDYPAFGLMASAHWMKALLQLGRAGEAARVARDDLGWLERIGSPICSEVLFLVTAADALAQSGDRAHAQQVLGAALRQIQLRAACLSEPELRASYMERREENRRAAELAREWGVA